MSNTPDEVQGKLDSMKVIGIARNISALQLDTAISPEDILLQTWQECRRQIMEVIESEGHIPMEDLVMQMRVRVMVRTKDDDGIIEKGA